MRITGLLGNLGSCDATRPDCKRSVLQSEDPNLHLLHLSDPSSSKTFRSVTFPRDISQRLRPNTTILFKMAEEDIDMSEPLQADELSDVERVIPKLNKGKGKIPAGELQAASDLDNLPW